MPGHFYIVNGDITRLKCDAWLLPSDPDWLVTASFANVVGNTRKDPYPDIPRAGWPENGIFGHRIGKGPEPDIWLGDVGRPSDGPIEHYAERAKAFAREACVAIRANRAEDLSARRRNPMIAFNVLGSGDGGKRSQRGQLLSTLIPAFLEITQDEVDVVLVCHGRVMYSAAQSFRRKCLFGGTENSVWDILTDVQRTKARELAIAAQKGELVLFLGAGISVDSGVPAWQRLLINVAEKIGLTPEETKELESFDPRDQGSILKKRLEGRVGEERAESLSRFVQNEMMVEQHGLVHSLLASLPVTEIVTTNFDRLFEVAAKGSGEDLAVLPGGDLRFGQRWLLKLHGDVGGEIVFTREEFLRSMSTHSALRGIVQAMLMTRHMLFVGYSLRDEDFHQLVHEVRFARDERASGFGTALVLEENKHMEQLWDEVNFVSMGMKSTSGEEWDRAETFAAARKLWIFLDLVGMLSSSEMAYLTDPSFDEVRSFDEDQLSRIVTELESFISNAKGDWPEIRQFLSRFGRHDKVLT